jgi:hypothetical protein
MNCPRCGRNNPFGSIVCAYCGTRIGSQELTKKQRRFTCVKCGKWLPLSDSVVGKKDTCKECEDRHARELAWERDREARRRATAVSAVIARHPDLRPSIMRQLGLSEFSGQLHVDTNSYDRICQWDRCVTRAKNLELARRYEDAAREYEKLEMWKQAGEMREKGSTKTVKHVNLNLNDLLDKLRDGGLAVPYKCRSCGASISVDGSSSVNGLKFCSYCGTATDTDTLMSILKSALK